MKIKQNEIRIRKTWSKNPATQTMEKTKKDRIRNQRRKFKQNKNIED